MVLLTLGDLRAERVLVLLTLGDFVLLTLGDLRAERVLTRRGERFTLLLGDLHGGHFGDTHFGSVISISVLVPSSFVPCI